MVRQILAFSLVLVVGILVGIGIVVSTENRNSALKPESPFIVVSRAYTNATDELIGNLSADSSAAGVDKAHVILKQRKDALDPQLAQLRALNPSEFGKDLGEFMKNSIANSGRLRKFLDGNKKLAQSVRKDSKLKAKLDDLLSTYSTIIQ